MQTQKRNSSSENSNIETLLRTSGMPPKDCERVYDLSLNDPNAALAEILNYSVAQNTRITTMRRAGATTRANLAKSNEIISALETQLSNSELEKQELMNSAGEDKLTGMQTKNGWKLQVYREISRAAREELSVAVTVFDLDHFKKINDTYGHHAGDIVLAQAAREIAKVYRVEDLKIRYGGEELLVVATGLSSAQSTIKAKQVMEVLQKPIEYTTPEGEKLLLPARTVSSGTVLYTPQRGNIPQNMPELLFNAADRLLYDAKEGKSGQKGRNQTHTGVYVLPEGLRPERIVLHGTPIPPQVTTTELSYVSGGGLLRPPIAADKMMYKC